MSWIYFHGYFVLSNGPNWGVICIIPIFGVVFGQNLGIWPPGVPIYATTPNCFAINSDEIPSCFVLNVFLCLLCMIKWFKLWSYLHNICIWVTFGQNLSIWPPGVPIYRVNYHCFAIHFEEIPSYVVLNVFLWLLYTIEWAKLGSYLNVTYIWDRFWSKFGNLTPWGANIDGHFPLVCN